MPWSIFSFAIISGEGFSKVAPNIDWAEISSFFIGFKSPFLLSNWTLAVLILLSDLYSIVTQSPIFFSFIFSNNLEAEFNSSPSIFRIISPAFNPALKAALLGVTAVINTPLVSSIPYFLATAALISVTLTPKYGLCTKP